MVKKKTPTDASEQSSQWVRLDRPIPLPSYVRDALQKLHNEGYVGYIVGGSVRDFLLGRESKDHDIATNALPDELCKLFPLSIMVGKEFGVIKVPTGAHPPLMEIATFRKDLDYQDHRHPTGVVFSSPAEDAERRDFTINALFYDPKSNRIFDPTGGIEDLKARRIRAIGDPSTRFKEDALRLLRAIRFKTQLGFDLDPDTSRAIQARARLISKVSTERVRDELTLMWKGPRPAEALRFLSELGLLQFILPEVQALKGVPHIPSYFDHEDLWMHLIKTLEFLVLQNPVRSFTLVWSIVLHEIGKPVVARMNAEKNFNGHELEGAKIAEKIADRFRFSRADTDQIVRMISEHMKFKDVFQMRESTLQRWIREDYFEELLAFHKADAVASDGNLAYFEFCLNRLESNKKSPPVALQKILDGKDLIQLGFQPGPLFSEILRVVEDLALERKLMTKDEALDFVVRNYIK
jgi:poly(A) polymerase